jgi:t-SNARE complex subunit (syntaxin)
LFRRLINTEIKEQEVLIGGLEKDVDTANEKMNVVLAALSKLLKTKDSCQLWTIVILGLILILLVALVIWA